MKRIEETKALWQKLRDQEKRAKTDREADAKNRKSWLNCF